MQQLRLEIQVCSKGRCFLKSNNSWCRFFQFPYNCFNIFLFSGKMKRVLDGIFILFQSYGRSEAFVQLYRLLFLLFKAHN